MYYVVFSFSHPRRFVPPRSFKRKYENDLEAVLDIILNKNERYVGISTDNAIKAGEWGFWKQGKYNTLQ